MSREHAPRPGAHWDTRIVPVEQVIPDDADAGHNAPQPRPNRADRGR